ncbi:MAG: hypothetical protein ABI461_16175, partial [Polyangiaceae bacterium]
MALFRAERVGQRRPQIAELLQILAEFAVYCSANGAACALHYGNAEIVVMLAPQLPIVLARSFCMDDVAEACRFAATEFVDGVRNGWGKRELAQWLLGPYHQISVLRLTREELYKRAALFPRAKVNESVDASDVRSVMLSAREDVLRVIDGFEAGYPQAESFIWRLQSRGLFARVEDSTGTKGLVPNEVASQRLAERVLSLVAVDYIARPFDYEDRA